jgi:hypothetical protein
MPKGYNFPAMVYLVEIDTQITLARRNGTRLCEETTGWLSAASSEDFDKAPPPLEIMEWCTIFLSAISIIQKMLFAGGRLNKPDVVERCEALQGLVGVTRLPSLSLAVRNAWEHLDERFDGADGQIWGGNEVVTPLYGKQSRRVT